VSIKPDKPVRENPVIYPESIEQESPVVPGPDNVSAGTSTVPAGKARKAGPGRKIAIKAGRIWLLSLAHLSAGILTFCLAVVAFVVMVLGSEGGRLWLINTVLPTALQDAGFELTLEEPASPGLGLWQFSKLAFAMDGQPLLIAESLSVDLRWRALFYGRIDIAEFSSTHLEVTLPESEEKDSGEEDAKTLTFELDTAGLPAIRVRHLQLGDVQLHIPGQKLPSLSAEGEVSALWRAEWLNADLNVKTLTTKPAALSLKGQLNNTSNGQVVLSLNEPAGGWIGAQMHLPATQPLQMDLAMTATRTNHLLDIKLEQLRLPWEKNELESTGSLSVNLEAREIHLHQLELSINQRPQVIQGTVSESSVDLLLGLKKFPLHVIEGRVPGLSGGQISGDLQLKGPWNGLQAEGELSGQSQYQGYSLSVQVAAKGTQNHIDIRSARAKLGELEVGVDGRVDIAQGTLDLKVHKLHGALSYLTLLDVELTPDLQLTVDADKVAVKGSWVNPTYRGRLRAQGAFRERPLALTSGFEGNIRQVRLQKAHLDSLASEVDAEGLIDWGQGRLDLMVEADRIPVELLQWLEVKLPDELSALASAKGQVSGSFESIGFSGDGHLWGTWEQAKFDAGSHLSVSAKTVKFDEFKVSLDVNPLLAAEDPGVANVAVAQLTSSGQLDIEELTLEAKASIRDLAIETLKLLHIDYPADLTGTVNGDFTLTGVLPLPKIAGSLQSEGVLAGEPFSLNVGGTGNDRRIDFNDTRLHWQDSDLVINGYFAPESFDLTLALSNFRSTSLQQFGVDLHPVAVNLEASLKGTPEHPELKGKVRANTFYQLGSEAPNATPSEFQWDLDIDLHDEVLSLRNTIKETRRNQSNTEDWRSQGRLDISTTWRPYLKRLQESPEGFISRDLPLDFHAQGHLDMAWLNQLIDEDIQTIKGQVNLDLTTQGQLSQPLLNGHLQLSEGFYENNLSQTTLDAMALDLEFHGNDFEILKGVASDGLDGRLNASGKVRWNDGKEGLVDLKVLAKNVSLLRREDMEGAVSGVLEAKGTLKRILLSGNIDVSPFQLLLDKIPDADIPELEVTVRKDEAETGLQSEIPLPKVDLDITLALSGQSYIRGRGLDAELEGQVIIRGPAVEPGYKGQFNVVRGTFELFGKRFNLTDGDVIFENDNIALYIEGDYRGSELGYIATLSGTLEDLDISLRTIPDLPEDEVLSRLLFGKSVKNISPLQAARLATAVQTLRGESGFDPIAATRDALGVDTLTVDSQETKEGNGLAVGVGKYVTEKVYVELERTPEPSQPWKGSIEIELTPSLNLETSTGGKSGFGGVELLWKNDY